MFHKRHPTVGAPPGTLVFRQEAVPARVQIVRYSEESLETIPVAGLDDISAPLESKERLWLDVAGIDDPDVLRAGGQRFGLPDLVMENIVNVPQRPKVELFDDKLLIIAHVLRLGEEGSLHIDQLSIVLGSDFVISVHSQDSHFLDPVRRRLGSSESRLRHLGSDYLAYSILDLAIDGYFPVLESLGEQLEQLEDEALEQAEPDVLKRIHQLRSQLIQVRRSSWPMRESLELLLNAETALITEDTKPFLRDARSHCAQTVDVVEMYRESAATLVSTYMSSVAHRSNEIMKVLTMMSSIFVPMSFIAGLYGMNFEYMPELSYAWSYPIALTAMFSMGAAMLVFFHRRGWLGRTRLNVGTVQEHLQQSTPRVAELRLAAPRRRTETLVKPVRPRSRVRKAA